MKKSITILLILVLIIVSGCTKQEVKKQKVKEKITNEVQEENKYNDNNNMPIGIYLLNNGTLTLQKEYQTTYTPEQDISVFSIYPSNEEKISLNKNYGESFYDKWIEYDPNHINKIGYNLKFTANNQEISYNVLTLNDMWNQERYMGIFLYDDYLNRNKSFYSHLETEDNNTFYSSIKIYANPYINEITSKITLTVFTYDSEDDFLNNEYRGNSKYTITICNKGVTC